MKKPILFCLFLLLIIPSTNALGIIPGLQEVDYIPGKEYKKEFNVIGVGTYNISLQGDPELVKNTQLSKQGIVTITESSNSIEVSFVIPKLSPGKHTLEVLVSQIASKKYGQPALTALVAVLGQVIVRVPYPDKYVVARIFADDAALGSAAYFDVELYNRGSKVIETTSGYVDILESNNTVVETVPLTTINNFISGNTGVIHAEWFPLNHSPGEYIANATVIYDENDTNTFIRFLLGDIFIDIVDIDVPELRQRNIAKISVSVKSKWNRELQTFATLNVEEIEIQSPTATITPWKSKTLPLFLDTNDLTIGNHTAQVTLHYAGKTNQKTITLEIKEPQVIEKTEVKFNITKYLDYIIIAALLVLVITIFVAIQKKQKITRQIYKNHQHQ